MPRPRQSVLLRITALALLLAPAAAAQSAPAAGETVPLATFLDDRPTVADPTAHHTLYLPASYDSAGRQPILLVFDPRGRARMAAELFREGADRYGWILVSSNDTRSDTGWEPNARAIAALWPEIGRLAVDPRRIYATGFSGGVAVAWVLGYRTGGLAGIIGVGGRLDPSLPREDPPFAHWGAAGSWDFNYDEMVKIDELFERQGEPTWLEIFDGPHTWLPPPLATQAMGWMELVAMRQGLAPRDAARIEQEWARLMAGAAGAEAAGELLTAFERYRQIESTFTGLRDPAAARAAAERLAEDPTLRKQRRERRRWDAADERYARQKVPLLMQAADLDPQVSAGDLEHQLDIHRLKRTAELDGWQAVAAKRMLHRVYTQASFYLPRRWLAEGSYRAAQTVLEVALGIRDEAPHVWYNLACAHARQGDARQALAALESAVERGFDDAALLRRDEALASLREREPFQRLLTRLEATPEP